jgi:catechol 2,3-dioxygenase-like lactoylglutathione lyase family enzyme
VSVRRLSHLGLCVSDLPRAVAFYRDGLGFAELSRKRFDDASTRKLLALPGGTLDAVYLRRDGLTLELLHFPQPGVELRAAPRPMNRVGLTHLSFLVDDLASVLAKIRALGGRVLEETLLDGRGLGSSAVFVCDPDGTRIELLDGNFDPAALC